jgi:hypothetical protein
MREFASQKALISYAERKGLIYLWEGTPAFARRQRLLSRDQYELAEVRTSRRGVRPATPQAIEFVDLRHFTDIAVEGCTALHRRV